MGRIETKTNKQTKYFLDPIKQKDYSLYSSNNNIGLKAVEKHTRVLIYKIINLILLKYSKHLTYYWDYFLHIEEGDELSERCTASQYITILI